MGARKQIIVGDWDQTAIFNSLAVQKLGEIKGAWMIVADPYLWLILVP